MKTLPLKEIFAFILTTGLGQLAAAADDLSGSWILSSEAFIGGGTSEATLTLKQEGAELSGAYEDGFGKPEIEEGKVADGEISFKITRTFGDRVFTTKYSGKLKGKLLIGSMTLEGFNEPRTVEWRAYRAPEIDPTGLWKWQTTSQRDGTKRDSWVKLTYAGGELTGTYKTGRGQSQVVDAKLEGKQISFKVVLRFGERSFSTAYSGMLGDKGLSGKITSRRGEEDRVVDWAAARDIPKVDPLGTWSWSRPGRDGALNETKITIKKEGDHLTGTLSGGDTETPIEDAKLDGDVLNFKMTRENDRGSLVTTYSGKIDGDVLIAKIGINFGERTFNRKVVAKRVLAKANPVGTWTWTSRRGRDGDSVENKLTLTKADGKLAGSFTRGDDQSALEDLALDGNTVSFKLQRTFRDNPVTLRYSGQIRGDSIKGSYRFGDSDEAGGWETFWNAERAAK
ncbi:MAG TPA: hypothetical protein QGF50_18615 [Roseibacillus sp.]|jgi:hypothetical protein|nr:hypothetical protein [Roseibacillus sp.]|tara:strand:+ start:435 stop:1793 length:1359 start_codon:yes stop_codon:yes gene_type:complete